MEQSCCATQSFVLNERWVFVPATDRILVAGGACVLQLAPVASRILHIMVQSPNTLIGRQTLLDEGWRHFGFEVGQRSLNQTIYVLRDAFETLHDARPSIRTLPRLGYCLSASVRRQVSATVRTRFDTPVGVFARAQG